MTKKRARTSNDYAWTYTTIMNVFVGDDTVLIDYRRSAEEKIELVMNEVKRITERIEMFSVVQ